MVDMPKVAKELGALAINRLTTPGWHAVGGVAGLGLQVAATGARSWVLRTVIAGKRRAIGLGGYPTVQPAQARQNARTARQSAAEGVDPVHAKRAARSALQAASARAVTFKHVAEQYIAAHTPSWRNPKHAAQWASTLETYAFPTLGTMLVADVDTAAVLRVLQAEIDGGTLWVKRTETAARLRGRIENVLDYAAAQGLREGLNPARWKGHLAQTLPSKRKVAPVEHHAAVAVAGMQAFMTRLRAATGIGARALEFAILTAARSGEVRGMTWGELDLAAAVWTVPAERMKARREHRVPLSGAALDLLRALPGAGDASAQAAALVFAGTKGQPLSDMTLTAVMRRMDLNAVPHGFRSTFRDWCAECTGHPRDVAEMALAHTIGDKVEAAYRRGDLFEKRRALMADWAEFLNSTPAPVAVLQIGTARRVRVGAR
jgi:integrase